MPKRDLEQWARQVTEGLKDSAAFCNLWNQKFRDDPLAEPIPLLQLGYAMMLDKPLVILCPQGADLPEHLARAADRIIHFDPDAPNGLEHAASEWQRWIKSIRGAEHG